MDRLPHVKLSGELEGDYVVLAERAGGQLKIAPEQPDGLPRIVDLERTTWACPTEGLEVEGERRRGAGLAPGDG